MTEDKILEKLKQYINAVYHKDFDLLVSYFYKEDLHLTRTNMEWMAKAMQPFGENEGFFRLFKGIETVEELAQLSDEAFVSTILRDRLHDMPDDKVKAMVHSTQVENISHADYIATVVYSFENVFAEDGSRIESSVQLILSENEWFVLFKPGIETVFDAFKKQIRDYEKAKELDQPDIAKETPDDEIEKFAIYGYRNYKNEVFIYPRFKDAGDFKNGLAPVKIFSKWGYIDKFGEIAITPAYDSAEAFSKKKAKVAKRNEHFDKKWGMINTKGKVIVPLEYDELSEFSNGLLAVQKGVNWGFVDKKGKLVIDCKYQKVTDFKKGKAQALYQHTDGNEWVIYIDKEGNELGEVPKEKSKLYYYGDYDDENDD